MKKLVLLLAFPLLAQEGAVEGVALNKMTKAPVAGVRVRLGLVSEPGKYYDGLTGADGKYRIDNIPYGDYSPNINGPDGFYGPNPMEMALKRTRVQVKEGVAKFDIEITPASVIRGRVLDPERRPVAEIRLLALPVNNISLSGATTDEEGRFSVQVAPGAYQLQARSRSDKWAPTFYPNVTDQAAAERIVVGEGADLGGYEIRLQPVLGNRLRGVVRDDQGKPAAGVDLTIAALERRVKSDAEGAFEFAAVSAGEWRISATATRDGVHWMGEAEVAMPNRDYDKAEVRIDPPFALDIELEGAPSERRTSLRFDLRPVAGPSNTFPVSEKNGRARFDHVYPGAYRVGVRGFLPGYYVKSILLGETDVTGRNIELSPSSPPLRVIYAPGPGRVTGEVEGGANAKVILISADRETYVPGMDTVTVSCDEKGRFLTNDLRPGAWYALAFTGAPTMLFNLRERVFDRGLWRQATTFRVAERETATLNLKASAWQD